MLAAFATGDPALAFEATQSVLEINRALSLELAKLRFSKNFGTEICGRCDGLHAGPGVVATCFQMRQCHYSNLREGEVSPRHLRAIGTLTRPK